MRLTSVVAGLALVLGACAGEKAGDQAATTDTAPAAAAPAPATGATHDVEMTRVDGQPRFVPSEISVKAGDVVRFHNKQGGPHNVMFFADSIPAGAAAALDAGMPDKMSSLTSQMAVEQDQVITVSFAGAPVGRYHFTCQPHQAMGMNGNITVQ